MVFKFFPLALLLLGFGGCTSVPPLPQVDLSQQGWLVQQGQALWRTGRSPPEIAGELLVATRADGSSVVQFSKPPFPVVTAATGTGPTWQVEFGPQGRRFSGRGQPPRKLLWLHLPQALTGKPLPAGLLWKTNENTKSWTLLDSSRGTAITGWFSP